MEDYTKIPLHVINKDVRCVRCGNKGAVQGYGEWLPGGMGEEAEKFAHESTREHFRGECMNHYFGFGGTLPWKCLNCGNTGLIDMDRLEGMSLAFRTEKQEAGVTVYNKLVRDLIPEVMNQKGVQYEIRTLSQTEYAQVLDEKLTEEVREYRAADNTKDATEELADIYEVLEAVMAYTGISLQEIEEAKAKKKAERGGFEKRIMLISTKK